MELLLFLELKVGHTGKSLSEALIFASTNPQYDDRLFIELQVQYMKNTSSNLGRTCSAKRRGSDKDLPVTDNFFVYISDLLFQRLLNATQCS